jgi:hypothetical protein
MIMATDGKGQDSMEELTREVARSGPALWLANRAFAYDKQLSAVHIVPQPSYGHATAYTAHQASCTAPATSAYLPGA